MMVTNYVGTVVPTEEEQRQLLADVASVYERLNRFGLALSPEKRRALPKPRIGSEKLMPLVSRLIREHGVSISGMSADGMDSDLKLGDFATSLEQKLALCRQIAADTRLAAYGEAWQAFLGFYAVLSTMSTRDPGLATSLRPVVEHMAYGPRRKKAKK